MVCLTHRCHHFNAMIGNGRQRNQGKPGEEGPQNKQLYRPISVEENQSCVGAGGNKPCQNNVIGHNNSLILCICKHARVHRNQKYW